jgi:hypothetical protein
VAIFIIHEIRGSNPVLEYIKRLFIPWVCYIRYTLTLWSGGRPCLALVPWPNPAPGPGLVAQTVFESGPVSGLIQIIAVKRYIEHFVLSRAIVFFHKEKVVRTCAHLMLVTLSGSGNKSHRLDFLGDFRCCYLPEIVRDNTLQAWHPISLYRSSNAKVTSHVLRASLNNPFKDCWRLWIKRNTIVGADCK